MSLGGLVARAQRRAAEALMVDTCTVRRVSGQSVNGTTLALENTYSTVYSGRCRVQLRDTAAAQPEAGEHVSAVVRTVVQIPVSVTGVRVDDEIVVSASADADLVSKVFRVRSVFHKTHLSSRRLECEEVQG